MNYMQLFLSPEHTFYGEDYQAALDLNFALGELAYAYYDYLAALELIGRAKISAEKLNDRDMLAATYHHPWHGLPGVIQIFL